ncbi:hypothetical protein SAMN05216359_101119 [Roseateles sp. YR242]|uniref:hypothetical protein n=1 Tax=Roseateles sp. YR242 TaxID=1855305 RepID=UPI0008BD3DA5|nr:hypothetical protein [Roseateles sp. YR242]SEK23556.1 hypothetical protein SAMN05216359_101119 [Roseateles sp. YR242]
MERERARSSASGTTRTPAQPLPQTPAQKADEDRKVDEIVRAGPSGAFAVAGLATAIVVALYLGFYLLVYLPRGAMQ